jgi:hypothetical protein
LPVSTCLSGSDEPRRFSLLVGGEEADADEAEEADEDPEEERDFLGSTERRLGPECWKGFLLAGELGGFCLCFLGGLRLRLGECLLTGDFERVLLRLAWRFRAGGGDRLCLGDLLWRLGGGDRLLREGDLLRLGEYFHLLLGDLRGDWRFLIGDRLLWGLRLCLEDLDLWGEWLRGGELFFLGDLFLSFIGDRLSLGDFRLIGGDLLSLGVLSPAGEEDLLFAGDLLLETGDFFLSFTGESACRGDLIFDGGEWLRWGDLLFSAEWLRSGDCETDLSFLCLDGDDDLDSDLLLRLLEEFSLSLLEVFLESDFSDFFFRLPWSEEEEDEEEELRRDLRSLFLEDFSSYFFKFEDILSCSSIRFLISSFFCSNIAAGIPSVLSSALINNVHNSAINSLAFLPSKKPVRLICIILASGYFSASSWLNTNSTTTSSSIPPNISVMRWAIHGFTTSKLILFISTFLLRISLNFNCFSSFFCLSLNLLSWSALVPRKKPASVIFSYILANSKTYYI